MTRRPRARAAESDSESLRLPLPVAPQTQAPMATPLQASHDRITIMMSPDSMYCDYLDLLAGSIAGTPEESYDPGIGPEGDSPNNSPAPEERDPKELWPSQSKGSKRKYADTRNEKKRQKTKDKKDAFVKGGGESYTMKKARLRKEGRIAGTYQSPLRKKRTYPRTTVKLRKQSRKVLSLSKTILKRNLTIEELKAAVATGKSLTSLR